MTSELYLLAVALVFLWALLLAFFAIKALDRWHRPRAP
jgi:hypothetical protein